MNTYHLAQLNVARMLGAADSAIMADFVNGLNRINALGEATPGFVWRLKSDADNAMAIRVFEDEMMIVNLTVWTGIDALYQFTYYSDHAEFFRRRREWFHKESVPMALWWLPADHLPTPQDARIRLEYLQVHGATPFAFTFRQQFTAEEAEAYLPIVPPYSPTPV
ncbi:MAG: DUF3291 domain-containing protein [Chloroflexota bacterium]|nr:DUF3291 domain-containing protein [Chloroflexota bacterium]